jgi:hypothetical protein
VDGRIHVGALHTTFIGLAIAVVINIVAARFALQEGGSRTVGPELIGTDPGSFMTADKTRLNLAIFTLTAAFAFVGDAGLFRFAVFVLHTFRRILATYSRRKTGIADGTFRVVLTVRLDAETTSANQLDRTVQMTITRLRPV